MQAFLGEGGDRGDQTRKPLADDAIGGEIRLGHRRSVGLAVDRHGAPVDAQDRGTGFGDEIGQGIHQCRGGITIDGQCGLGDRRHDSVSCGFACTRCLPLFVMAGAGALVVAVGAPAVYQTIKLA